MTNEEFIESLSPKAKEIISNYQCKNTIKREIVVYLNDNTTRVNMNYPNKYIFEIKRQDSLYDMEYAFLHEFYHCVQKDSGFPSTSYINIKYQKLSGYLSSIILDCDVYDRLLNDGYKENPDILQRKFNDIQNVFLVASRDRKFDNHMNEIDNQVYYAGMILLLSKFYSKHDNIDSIINFTKTHFPIIYKDYIIFTETIKRYGFTSPKRVRKIFKTVIREFGLEELITIV